MAVRSRDGSGTDGDELNDELKKLGLRLRHRKVGGVAEKPGKIAFDERGNATFEWNNDRLNEDGDTGERLRNAALNHPGLSMVDDEQPANAPIRTNPKGLRVGYNPYESGMLAKKEWKPKRDLRELSKWIETRKKINEKPPGEE
jgi:hypothetical protein